MCCRCAWKVMMYWLISADGITREDLYARTTWLRDDESKVLEVIKSCCSKIRFCATLVSPVELDMFEIHWVGGGFKMKMGRILLAAVAVLLFAGAVSPANAQAH